MGADYAVLVINLDQSPERMERTKAAFSRSPVPLRRIPGVYGGYIPSAACRALTGGASRKGTLGTFLAHVAAWEAVVASEFGHSLIVEDDAAPIMDLPARVADFGIPAGFDLCFVNERMQPDILPPHHIIAPITSLLSWPADKNAPGGDGYMLSKPGAAKLLELVAQDGFGGDVDWRLVGYSIGPDDLDRLSPDSTAAAVLQNIPRQSAGRLTAYVLTPPVIRTANTESIRRAADQDLPTPREIPMEVLGGKIVQTMIEGREVSFYVQDETDLIQREHAQGRFYEREELDLIRSHFTGGCFIDVGAHIGNHTVYAAKYLNPSRVICIEPNPRAIEILSLNVRLNGLDSIVDRRYLGIGLSSAPGLGKLHEPQQNNSGAMQIVAGEGDVRLAAGDDLFHVENPAFLKIDVEGMEMEVLRGFERLIARCSPIIRLNRGTARRFRRRPISGSVAACRRLPILMVCPLPR